MTTLKQSEPSKFKTWYEAVAYAQKKRLWGKVTIIQEGDFYVIVDKR